MKYYGGFNLFEMSYMTAEDRKWHINRIKEEIKKQEDASSKNSPKGYSGSKFS